MKRLLLTIFIAFVCIVSGDFCGTPGTLNWSIKPETSNIPSPAIGKDGTVYWTLPILIDTKGVAK